jgi:hypothetical protein
VPNINDSTVQVLVFDLAFYRDTDGKRFEKRCVFLTEKQQAMPVSAHALTPLLPAVTAYEPLNTFQPGKQAETEGKGGTTSLCLNPHNMKQPRRGRDDRSYSFGGSHV